MLKQIKKIIIIAGCQRSGTTLLGLMIGAPENTVLLDESDGVYEWFDLFINNQAEADAVFSRVLGNAKDKYISATPRIISNQENNFVLASGISYLVLKAPNLTYRYNDIARSPLPVSIIFAVRDPKAVIASMIELEHIDFIKNQLNLLKDNAELTKEFSSEIMVMSQRNHQAHINHALLWAIKSSLFDRFADLELPAYLCKYEDLIQNSSTTCKKIAASINIPFNESMLAHSAIYQGTAQGRTDRIRSIDAQSIDKWKSKFNKQQIQQIYAVSETTMKTLGYTAEFDRPNKLVSSTICILGMHRSGTSCLTGCLQDCGLNLGEVVNQAPYNKKGNKESLTVREINDKVLALSGGSWDHPPESLFWDDEVRSDRELFISIYSPHNQWGFKDPRTLLTLPFWLEAMPELKFIGTFRHPVAVARSHQHRNKMTIEAGLELWKKYNLKLLEYFELYNFPLVCFDWQVDDYMQTTINIARNFGLKQISSTETIPFYENSLRQQNSDNIGLSIPEDILTLYENLCSKAEDFRLSNKYY